MDSEALLADHQTTDEIVEEKNTVKESKDEENSAIVEAERLRADRVVVRESVIYCSKMPSSTSEKECRKEEESIEEVVDSIREVVEVSPTEEATNKNIEMIANNNNGVPLETAPVESNNANSVAGDAEEISEQVVEQAKEVTLVIPTESSCIAVETREIEAKLEDQKVPTDSVSAKITDNIEVVADEVEKQVLNEEAREAAEAKIEEDEKKEAIEIEELEVGTETNEVTLSVLTADEIRNTEDKIVDDEKETAIEVQEQAPIGSDTLTSANRIVQETKRLESKLIDDDQEVLEAAKKPFSSEESSDVGTKMDDGKTDVEPEDPNEVQEQVLSVSSTSTSADRIDEETKKLEAELIDEDKAVPNDFTSAISTSDEFRETEAKIESYEEGAVTEVGEQISSDSSTSVNRTDEVKLADDNREAVANSVVAGAEGNKEIETELKDNKQEEEYRKQELNQGSEADAANDNGQVLTDHTSGVQTAGEISQPEEVETNKIDSGSFAELPIGEEKPDVRAESVDKKENILEDKTSMDNVNDVNMISQVPRSNVQYSQTDVKDIDIEIPKEDKITLVESPKNLDCSNETNDEFEGKKSSEDSKHSYASDITESSNKIEKSEVAKEKCEDSENKTSKSVGENADASSNLSVENKTSEDEEEKQSKDESVDRDYVEAPKDIDVKEEIATAVSAFVDHAENKNESEKAIDESLSPQEVPKESAPAKSSPRRSNNIISKVKHQIVKAKKAILGKSPSSKDMSPKSKEEVN